MMSFLLLLPQYPHNNNNNFRLTTPDVFCVLLLSCFVFLKWNEAKKGIGVKIDDDDGEESFKKIFSFRFASGLQKFFTKFLFSNLPSVYVCVLMRQFKENHFISFHFCKVRQVSFSFSFVQVTFFDWKMEFISPIRITPRDHLQYFFFTLVVCFPLRLFR